jgi:hypothetical protein
MNVVKHLQLVGLRLSRHYLRLLHPSLVHRSLLPNHFSHFEVFEVDLQHPIATKQFKLGNYHQIHVE